MASTERSVSRLTVLYRRASKAVVREIKRGVTESRYLQLLSISQQIDSIVAGLGAEVSTRLEEEVRRHYIDGQNRAYKVMIAEGLPVSGAMLQIDEEAIKALFDESDYYFAEAMMGLKRSGERILSEVRKRRIREIISTGKITAQGVREIKADILAILEEELVAMIDKGGRKWKLEVYAEMLARTKLIESANTGMTNRLLREGFDLVQVSQHSGACELCVPWEGEILSISGRTEGYSTVDDAKAAGLFHPNCKHRLVPWHQELASMRH